MLKSSFIGLIFFFSLIGSVFIVGTSHAQTSIPIELTKQGHVLVKAKINGVEGNFILDTGGGMTLITKNFSTKLQGLHIQDGTYTAFRATGEQMTVDLYDAKSLVIGGYTESHPLLTIIDVNFGPIDGLISLMSFKEQPFTIDHENKKLTFETTKSLAQIQKKGKTIALQLEASRDRALDIFAFFTVNNKLTLQFLIDSGAGNDVYRINARYMPQLGVDSTDKSKVSVSYSPSEFNPKIRTKIYKANLESIAPRDVKSIENKAIKASFIEGLIYDGVVSLNWIGKRITFDLKHTKMIVN